MPRVSLASAPRCLPRCLFIGAGLALLGVVSIGIAGAQTRPVCKQDGTDAVRCFFVPEDETGSPLGSLKTASKPVDPQLNQGGRFIRSQTALVQLGKALFWDQQVGSDGQACGSCHFSAGADARDTNQISPGLKNFSGEDHTFQVGGPDPNHTLVAGDFPIHKLADPNNAASRVLRDANDTVASAGVFFRTFSSINPNPGGLDAPRPAFDRQAVDLCSSTADPAGFRVGGVNVRRVEPRNTPTMINARFNNRNFWDSRAQDVFNGVDPFGARNANAVVWEDQGAGAPKQVRIAITFSSLASQAVGPPLSNFEMSCDGRTFVDVGHKLLTATSTPLAEQTVSTSDSVLGRISNNAVPGKTDKGLNTTYEQLVEQAFQPAWWGNNVNTGRPAGVVPQIEANFSLFWGLAVQAYMETLQADNSPVDQFFTKPAGRRTGLGASALRGLNLFQSAFGTSHNPQTAAGTPRINAPVVPCNAAPCNDNAVPAGKQRADLRCTACHGGPETTGASIDAVTNDARLERMTMATGAPRDCAIYDAGHFNTGVRRTDDDRSLGFSDPFGHSFGETDLALAGTLAQLVPTARSPFGLAPPLSVGTFNCDGANTLGTFKAPQLRNVELTGPYFHNGGQLTLRQVIDFYNRGADFAGENLEQVDPNVHALNLGTQDKTDLLNFLLALTDERVAFERAPFDHPSICVANGERRSFGGVQTQPALPGDGPTAIAADNVLCVDAVGAAGRATRLKPFLGANLASP
jgi:cytochrome c peroxidase